MLKVIASHNGRKAAVKAFEMLSAGAAPLDACVEGITLVEDDPDELTVGYGGLPNAAGEVELDAAVMDGLTHRGGSVAALRGVRHATRVAQRVMQQTTRVMLVGPGAREFALAQGFPDEDLLTPRAREMWLYWKRTLSTHDDWRPPAADESLDVKRWFDDRFYKRQPEGTGTVHCAAIDAAGNMACATSTSGHAFKLPGRVGDSPVLGAGLYVDNQFGTCGSIGHGEANLQHVSSFAAVELMRQGKSIDEAGQEILRRIADAALPEERDEQGRPTFNLQFYLLDKQGRHGGASLWDGKQMIVSDHGGTRLEDCVPLLRR